MKKKRDALPGRIGDLMFKALFVLGGILLATGLQAQVPGVGDVNGDGMVTITDAYQISNYVSGLDAGVFDHTLADVNGNGKITIEDALMVAHYTIGTISSFLEPLPRPTPLYPANWNSLINTFPALSRYQKERLFNNSFVVLDSYPREQVSASYHALAQQPDLPLFVTSDMLLHLYHITYTDMLRQAELDFLFSRLQQVMTTMFDGVIAACIAIDPEDYPLLLKAARRVLVYCAVGYGLIHQQPSLSLKQLGGVADTQLLSEINLHLTNVLASKDVEPLPGDDYTQYKPRGHYAGDAVLESYFQTIKWLQRRKFDLRAGDAEQQLRAAAILSRILNDNEEMLGFWQSMADFQKELSGVFKNYEPPTFLELLEKYFEQQGSPLQGYYLPETLPNDLLTYFLQTPLPEVKTVQLVGESDLFYLDTLEQLLDETVAGRNLPGGLELAATLLDSGKAYELLEDERLLYNEPGADLDSALKTAREEYALWDPDAWHESLYSRWHNVLRTLSEPVSTNAPDFFQSGAWAAAKVNTQLASWTELHSDSLNIASGPTPTQVPTEIPTPEPTPTMIPTTTPGGTPTYPPQATPSPVPNIASGEIYLQPANLTAGLNMEFTMDVLVDTGEQRLAAYGFSLTFNPNVLQLELVDGGAAGISPIANTKNPGLLTIAGFSASGVAPSSALHLCTIHWIGRYPDRNSLAITVKTLIDDSYTPIGTPRGVPSTVTVEDLSLVGGDVDDNGMVNIVDALKVAQYYVGLVDETTVITSRADVQMDGNVNIVDALMIAQYYVRKIPTLPTGATPTPVPGYVEPNSAFYNEFQLMCDTSKKVAEESGFTSIHDTRFFDLGQWAAGFAAMASDIEAGGRLTTEQNQSVRNWVGLVGTFFEDSLFLSEDGARSNVIFDLYSYEDRIIHMAVGKLSPVIMLYQEDAAARRPLAAVGYVLSYYKLFRMNYERLSDQDWEGILNSITPYRPLWADEFVEY